MLRQALDATEPSAVRPSLSSREALRQRETVYTVILSKMTAHPTVNMNKHNSCQIPTHYYYSIPLLSYQFSLILNIFFNSILVHCVCVCVKDIAFQPYKLSHVFQKKQSLSFKSEAGPTCRNCRVGKDLGQG